ncbi:uncharacterized protein EI90DRAFT_2537137 [Cantharellus anzutake]|uniref:uncharacterized protein n=1 Tax=Cantharellus anzutake TaxID=1750568 RepID=UPI0019081296|nr:uncharacterized protein EI90DRAFT_2537137 [Cantharellus anzutake]KAF8338067.1 hypothetical protein EI90DRAFT_2537137 [Cantharellus anzutake]
MAPTIPGIEKIKGRTRHGCLTCRIRHKHCVQNEGEEPCLDCKKLRLECLAGYGLSRPQWLKDNDPRKTKVTKAIKLWTKKRAREINENEILMISPYASEEGDETNHIPE